MDSPNNPPSSSSYTKRIQTEVTTYPRRPEMSKVAIDTIAGDHVVCEVDTGAIIRDVMAKKSS